MLSLMSSIDQATTLDLAVVREQSVENPVFYVQIAHARIGGIARKARRTRHRPAPLARGRPLAARPTPASSTLIRCLDELPEVVAEAAIERAPNKVTIWVRRLAT